MPKISLNLRREPTDVDATVTTTFNAPGNYVPPYGKTTILVGGQGAPGTATSGGTYAGTNPASGGNYAGTYSPSGGNYWYTNPATPGNYAGTNATGYYWSQYVTINGYSAYGYTAYNTGYNTVNSDYPTINISGYFNSYGVARYDATGTKYVVGYANQLIMYATNDSATYAVPASYSVGGNYTNYQQISVVPGGAYYNPTVPGNAVYTPISPGYAYYNAPVPGNAYYNPTVPGNAGTPFSLGGVYFQGGAADGVAPTVSPTSSTLVYNGQPGITVTVPSGGYIQITSKATNTY